MIAQVEKFEDNPQTNNFKNTEIFVIVRIIIGRGSSCRPGLGACSASVLWWEVWHAKSMNNLEESDREICSPIVEENSINYVYLYFDEDVSNYSEDDLVFVLENELQAINEKDESVITLPVGTYYYNSSIGEFGGYKIALIKSSDYNVFC